MYVAGKRMDVPGRGIVQPGTPLPEAAGWKCLRVYLDQRRILVVADEDEPRELTNDVMEERLRLGGRGPIASPEASKSDPPSRLGALRAALASVKIAPKSFTAQALWALGVSAGLELPPRRPSKKGKVVSQLAELAGVGV